MARSLMIQGAGSNVGKSLMVAGLARAFVKRGLKVRPFKPQNMSNNAAVTVDGGEIGRAQALQALACGVDPVVDMNPVLLKPETDIGAQVIVQGKRVATVPAREFSAMKPKLLAAVLESFQRLGQEADLVLVEGAGSPAEVNLRAGDIANMGFARAANCPVVLVGDIDRGGVIAQLIGTQEVLDPEDAAMIAGFAINKFRGDPTLFDDGYRLIAERTGWRGLGVVPWFADARKLPAEDALDISGSDSNGALHVACLVLSRIANFDDLDPLGLEPEVRLSMIEAGDVIPPDADLVIIPGTKSTRGDLAFLRAQGWDIDIAAHVRRGGRVLGLCGGYQMLGRRIVDPEGLEGPAGETEGLGLLDIETVMVPDKRLTRVQARHVASGEAVSGYEIHIGRSDGPDRARPFAEVAGSPEGAISPDGRIIGSYLHGLFSDDGFRAAFLRSTGGEASGFGYDAAVEETLDKLADHLERHMALDAMLALAHPI
ncbi:cobyric acid synthase [Aliiruegeria sabulilitoris]|uniref:cobyric acid synthase n=1 Tax=Aliiruegeria sabulilitoris TaxID=1510458 RepID=UPI00082C8258|nr:cobyric acid synthase [Aliiruegeria sabulilitoris]NDR59239.1 cobyric acid synthase [Pseudoruegeria sp. M32A2M]